MSSFNDEEDRQPVKKVGLKKNNDQSSIKVAPNNTAHFNELAKEKLEKIEDYKKQMWDLATQFKSFVENRVLPENKGPIAANLEKETIEKLIKLASDMNEDETQDEGAGGTALCMILLKCMLYQRDIINKLSYKVDFLDKTIKNANK